MHIQSTPLYQDKRFFLTSKRTLVFLPLAVLAFLLFIFSHLAYAQTEIRIGLAGILGENRAVVTFNGGSAQTLKIGDTKQGITLLSIQGQKATFLVQPSDGESKKITLGVGHSPMRVVTNTNTTTDQKDKKDKPSKKDKKEYCTPAYLVLTSTNLGMFETHGFINGRSVRFMVDTGATGVSMSAAHARAIGVPNYKEIGRKGTSHTANGTRTSYYITLDSVRIGQIELKNIGASVGAEMDEVLLGNTFLKHLEIEMNGSQMILRKVCP